MNILSQITKFLHFFTSTSNVKTSAMNKKVHAKYFSRFLNLLPPRLSCHDSTRATIAFFAVSGIDVLDSLDLLSDEAKQNIINWIYNLQVIPSEGGVPCGGFQVCFAISSDST
jgi:prenyltransferase beta subunit